MLICVYMFKCLYKYIYLCTPQKAIPTNPLSSANRIKFGDTSEEYGDSTMGLINTGMLGKEGSGKIRVRAADKRSKTKLQLNARKLNVGVQATSGFHSLAFTPMQGMELIKPAGMLDGSKTVSKIFGPDAGFKSSLSRVPPKKKVPKF